MSISDVLDCGSCLASLATCGLMQDTLVSLDHIFIQATRTEHEAATVITKVAQGYLRRKKHFYGMQVHA